MSENNLIPEGYYQAVAVRTTAEDGSNCYARFAFTKNDTRQVVAYFKILDLPEGVSQGFPLPWYGFFTKDAGKRTVEALRYMGLKGNSLENAMSQDLDQTVSVKIEHSEWDGKTNARVAFVNAPGGGNVKLNNPMDVDQLRQFSAMMRDSLAKVPDVEGERTELSTPQSTQSSASPNRQEEPPPVDDDEIPF